MDCFDIENTSTPDDQCTSAEVHVTTPTLSKVMTERQHWHQ